MKFAVFGDIHGNIDALRAVYQAAIERKADKIYHLGDIGGYAPFVNEVAEFLVENRIEGVQGNYDEAVGMDKEHCGCRYENGTQASMMDLGFNWTKEHVTPKTKEYMLSLPFRIDFTCERLKIALFHATPSRNNLYWTENRDDGFFIRMAAKADADVMIYGHTHKPYRKDLGGKVFINAGSVGKPKDGDTRACFLLLDIKDGTIASEFLRLSYDAERVASAIVESGLPGYFADRLREGR